MELIGRMMLVNGSDRTKKWTIHPVSILLVVILTGLIYALSFAPKVSGADDAVYIVLAKALATGQGFRSINLVGSPPATHYPFGFPLLLVPVMWLQPAFPQNVPALVAVPIVCTLISVWLTALLLQRLSGSPPMLALPVAFLTGFNYLLGLMASTVVLSEPSYLALSLLALLVVSRPIDSLTPAKLVLAAFLLVSCYFVRTVGVTIIIAAVIYLLIHHGVRRALSLGMTCSMLAIPWFARNAIVGTSALAQDYGDIFLLKDWWHPELGMIESPIELVGRVLRNLMGHITQSLPFIFLPTSTGERLVRFLTNLHVGWVPAALGLIVAVILAVGLVDCLRRRWGVVELYVLCYVGFILLPPWHTDRNLIPIIPFLFYYFLTGLIWLGNTLAARIKVSRAAIRVGIGTAAVVLAASNMLSLRHNLAAGAAYRQQGMFYIETERSLAEASAWLVENSSTATLALYRWPEKLYLYTGRQAPPCFGNSTTIPIVLRDPEVLLDEICRQVEFVVVLPVDDSRMGIERVIDDNPDKFAVTYETSARPRAIVYRVLCSKVEEDKACSGG